MNETGCQVAQMWHEILMNSSTGGEAEKYPALVGRSPVEIRIVLMAGASPELLLREYISVLKIPKSTLTSVVDRLEKQRFVQRTINPKDRRSYSLVPGERGRELLKQYAAYQQEIGARIVSGLSGEEKEQLVSLLSKISSYMVRR